MKRHTLRPLAAMIACAALVGCGGETGGTRTPDELVDKFADAMERGDGAAVRSMIHTESDKQKQFTALMGEVAQFLGDAKTLHEKAKAKFGEKFTTDQSVPFAEMTDELARLRQAEIRIDGDQATIVKQGDGEGSMIGELTMRKVDGVWYLAANEKALSQMQLLKDELPRLQKLTQQTLEAVENSETFDQFQEKKAEITKKIMEEMIKAPANGKAPKSPSDEGTEAPKSPSGEGTEAPEPPGAAG